MNAGKSYTRTKRFEEAKRELQARVDYLFSEMEGHQQRVNDILSVTDSAKKSRVQPDHEVTTWYRKHGHKYKNRREAVRQFLQIPSDTMKKSPGMLNSLYNRLDKDLRKRPLKAPKTKRKIR